MKKSFLIILLKCLINKKIVYIMKSRLTIESISYIILFQGLVTLVTGGASGLGRGTVERFAKQGAKVVIADLPNSKGNDLAKELGDSAVFVPVNVSLTGKKIVHLKLKTLSVI